jgi:hypothetical protein
LTFPAHQAVVLPIKFRWPQRTDATAMCVGAASPDLLNSVPGVGSAGHSVAGVVLGAVPLTMVICWWLRWRAAAGVFAHLPDAGPFRVHSYRVIARRRPGVTTTLVGALLGASSHVLIDAFTHGERWGATWLNLDEVLFTLPLRGGMTGAMVLQSLGHSLGSLIAVAMFLHIGRARLLERWYGTEAVAAVRAFTLTQGSRVRFWGAWTAVALSIVAALVAAGGSITFGIINGVVFGALVAGTVAPAAPTVQGGRSGPQSGEQVGG